MNVNQKVWKLIDSDLALQRDLARGIVNTRALGRYFIDCQGVSASLDAVISAIRRYSLDTFEKEEKQLINLFSAARITTRNNIVCFTLTIDKKTFLDKATSGRFVTGTDHIKFLVTEDESQKYEELFKNQIVKAERKLGEISIMIRKEATETKGVMARIATQIALHDINIIELLVCPPEFLIYVKEKDLVETHNSLMGLVK